MNPFIVLLSSALINNYVLTQFLGMCPFFGVSRKSETALGMGLSVTFVMIISTAITYPIYNLILLPLDMTYLQTIVFILVIASIVQFLEVYMKKTFRNLYATLGVYLPLITTNCAILGVTLLNIKDQLSFVNSLVNSVGAGLGFMLAITLMAGLREKYDSDQNIPIIFRGFPLALFTAGLMSIVFLGFQGLVIGR